MPRLVYLFTAISTLSLALIASTADSRAQEVTVIAYPRIYNYPGQQLCQVDRNDRRYREFCAPQSYHPFGGTGYRPFGTYRVHRSVHWYRVAPDARVVHVDPNF